IGLSNINNEQSPPAKHVVRAGDHPTNHIQHIPNQQNPAQTAVLHDHGITLTSNKNQAHGNVLKDPVRAANAAKHQATM
ncbi:2,5-didehydrogluconate reductase DkgB, partial [Stenotrophomonas maltophilia]